MLDHLNALNPPLPELSLNQQAELDALHHLSDDTLWTIVREQLPDDVQQQARDLMTKNNRGELSEDETHQLEAYMERADRLMLRKAETASILQSRGYTVTQADL